jgi:hypothetical protein
MTTAEHADRLYEALCSAAPERWRALIAGAVEEAVAEGREAARELERRAAAGAVIAVGKALALAVKGGAEGEEALRLRGVLDAYANEHGQGVLIHAATDAVMRAVEAQRAEAAALRRSRDAVARSEGDAFVAALMIDAEAMADAEHAERYGTYDPSRVRMARDG